LFVIFNDLDIIGAVEGDPLKIKAFIEGAEMETEEEEFEIVEDQEEEEVVETEEDETPVSEDDTPEKEEEEEVDAEREAIRERRRKEKKERKERQEAAKKRDKLELDFLRQQNDELEKRLSGIETRTSKSELSAVEKQLSEAVKDIELSDKVIAKAIEAGNGDDATQALRYRDQAISKANQLKSVLDRSKKQEPQKPKVDHRVQEYAKEFVSKHSWYDPKAMDEDSAIVSTIDKAVARDGFDPRSPDYWDELEKRVQRRLPERFESQKSERTNRGGPKLGSGKEHAPSSSRKEVYISPERKKALIDAGVWDDPILRKRYVKQYMEYDRLHKD